MLQDLLKRQNALLTTAQLAAAGATLIAASSLCNGLGRLIWGALSDHLGRIRTFRLLLGGQILVFLALRQTTSPWIFSVLVCYVLLCYGGGFGCMPSFVSQVYGPQRMPIVYGIILTAWSAAGIVGPQVTAIARDHFASQAATFVFGLNAALLTVSLTAAFLLRDKPFAPSVS
jgi:OFA family oxalate/formate antiporter-like MFS transporter